MHIIKQILKFTCLAILLSSCHGNKGSVWRSEEPNGPVSAPTRLQYGTDFLGMYGTQSDTAHSIAVLIPTSGPNAKTGKSIRLGIETAAMRFAPDGLQINFYDTGNGNLDETIDRVISSNPEMIIGPVFADSAKLLRDKKNSSTPALSFTSDVSAVGDGIISMAVMPSNIIETIVKEMSQTGGKKFITIAPNNASGPIMANVANAMADFYDMNNVGIFYYTERDTDSIKSAALDASMYKARSAANTRGKEILSAILNHENLSAPEKYSLSHQLENLNRVDTLGDLPYDSILFLGDGNDTKSMASFLRYYGVGTRDAKFYGTPLWEETDIASDLTMMGAMYATLPEIPEDFKNVYSITTGNLPTRMSTIGYESTILAIGTLYSRNDQHNHLTNPSGYMGINGLFRLHNDGTNERALRIMRLNGDGTASVARPEATSFTIPIYKTSGTYTSAIENIPLSSDGINPLDYIKIPDRFKSKYRSKTYGVNHSEERNNNEILFHTTTVLPINDTDSITSEDYQPVPLDNISRTYIDSVEVTE
ncbi:MAG: penicillin-binding protein activator [Alphaproteobacteria bacterium]|nr:penicillin-binding protein activator [Alphaproteobacteria bacterium]